MFTILFIIPLIGALSWVSLIDLISLSIGTNISILSLIPLMAVTNNPKQSLDPNFITGFTDAEGCFMVVVSKRKDLLINWTVQAVFKITLHSKDLPLLKEIQTFFGGIGSISFYKDSVSYSIQDIKSLTSVIIPHFDNYPLQGVKKIDYDLWKQCINLKIKENKLTLSHLEQILAIKGALNLGLSDKLKTAFPNVKILTRPEYIKNEGILNPYWITGFTAGDASFTFSISENRVYASYIVKLHKRDEPLLLRIKEFFDSKGNVWSSPTEAFAIYRIDKKFDLASLIMSHFDNFPLSGLKLNNYLIWREMVELLTNKAHLTEEGLIQLKLLRLALNKN